MEKKERPAEPATEREASRAEAAPLPKDVIEGYAADGIDVTGLTADDVVYLQTLESLPFRDEEERLKELRELIPALVENRREARAEQEAAERQPLARVEEAVGIAPEPGEVIELPVVRPAEETAAGERRAERPAVFDPEQELEALIRSHDRIGEEIAKLPEQDRPAARERLLQKLRQDLERYKGDLLDQHRGMSAIIEAIRETVLANIETEAGLPLDKMIELADQASDFDDPAQARQAQKQLRRLRNQFKLDWMLRREWWVHGISLEETMQPKAAKLDETAILEAVEQGGARARLTPEQKMVFERLAESIIERRQAISEVRQQAPTPEELYRFCFGREPLGKVTVVEGPITLYFRCEDIDDYALIFSQKFAHGEIGVTDEDRRQAQLSGGVSISATRAYSPRLEQDPDLAASNGTMDRAKIEARRQLLKRLEGAIIAENNNPPHSFLDRWRIYRHEEQHAFKKILDEFELGRLEKKASGTLRKKEEAEEFHDELIERILQSVVNAERIRKEGGDPEADIQKYREGVTEVEQILNETEAQLRREARSYTEEAIEARAKDEILAYYLEGRLAEALEIHEMRIKTDDTKPPPGPEEPIEIDLIEPYLKQRKTEKDQDALYDYHASSGMAEYIIGNIVIAAYEADFESRQAGTEEAPEKAETELEANARQAQEALKADKRRQVLRPMVHKAMAEHRDRYHGILDDAQRAIETLENAGMKKQEIIDTLSIEPLRRWPKLASRLVKSGRKPNAADRAAPESELKVA